MAGCTPSFLLVLSQSGDSAPRLCGQVYLGPDAAAWLLPHWVQWMGFACAYNSRPVGCISNTTVGQKPMPRLPHPPHVPVQIARDHRRAASWRQSARACGQHRGRDATAAAAAAAENSPMPLWHACLTGVCRAGPRPCGSRSPPPPPLGLATRPPSPTATAPTSS